MMEDAVIHHPSFHQVSLIFEVNHRMFLQKVAEEVLTPPVWSLQKGLAVAKQLVHKTRGVTRLL